MRELFGEMPEGDATAAAAVRDRAARVLRPAGALARLDEVAAWLASWQRTEQPHVEAPAALVFAADHGVGAERVSAYPQDVTSSMLEALRAGVATANVLAREIGATIEVVDVGVGRPSGNLAHEPALTAEAFEECVDAGRRAVGRTEADLLVFGEMGIANTTVASAVCAALFGGPAGRWVGRGTGIDDDTYARKVKVVEMARGRIAHVTDPLEVLREVGGGELVAIAGATLEARLRSIPVVLDGFVVTAAVAPLQVVSPGALDHCVAGHRSAEAGHHELLARLGLEPLIDLSLRLGEGSGALLAVPLVRLAAVSVSQVATFEEWGLQR